MKEYFEDMEVRGLPGGPNQVFTYVTGMFSTDGYKSNSSDVDNPFNIIDSNKITMKGVDFPVLGVDDLGNAKIMEPGGEYEFEGGQVFEIPIKKEHGGEHDDPIKTEMLDEVVVTAPKKKKFLDTRLGRVLSTPLRGIDNTLQLLSIPGSLIAEGIEGITGKGDGKFNLRDIMPDLEKNIFEEGAFGKTASGVLNVDGVPGFLLDVATDPLTYLGGAGILRNIGTKTASKAPSLLSKISPRITSPSFFSSTKQAIPGTNVVLDRPSGFNQLFNFPFSKTRDKPGVVDVASFKSPFEVAGLSKRIPNTGEAPYYSIHNLMMSNPMTAGRTMKAFEDIIPRGSIIKQAPTGSLSEDSFAVMLNRLKNPKKFADVTEPYEYVALNRMGKNKPIELFTSSPTNRTLIQNNLFDEFELKQLIDKYGPNMIKSVPTKIPGLANTVYNVGVPNIALRKLYKEGGNVSWMWKGQKHYGTLIPSMEDSKNRYARTKNGKIKTLPKASEGGDPIDEKITRRKYKDVRKDLVDVMSRIDEVDQGLNTFRTNIDRIYRGFLTQQDVNLSEEQKAQNLSQIIGASQIDPDIFKITDGNVIGLDSVPAVTRNWINSLDRGFGCTSYGCGIIRKAGARTEDGSPFPIISGNSELNEIIEKDLDYKDKGGLQSVLMPAGFKDLQPGDRIVSNYSTTGGSGASHTMIFTGEYDENGSPMVMENSGGSVDGGISIRSLQDIKGVLDTSDPNSGIRVTRYDMGRSKLEEEKNRLLAELENSIPEERAISTIKGESIEPIVVDPIGGIQPVKLQARTYTEPERKGILGKIKNLLKKEQGGNLDLKHTYKKYINGELGEQEQIKGLNAYDKLNRIYYRDAKSMGMSVPNYIMTYIIDNS